MKNDVKNKDKSKYPKEDWLYEVRNGDTVLGYREWVEHKIESEDSEKS